MTDDVISRDPEIQELLDKQAIREAIMRYCRGADRCDAELVGSAYHADARDQRPGQEFTGATVGEGIVNSLLRTMEATNHQIGTQLIQVNGDVAASESYSTGSHILKDGRRLRTLVRYLDQFERRNGEWKIAHRQVITDAMDVSPIPDDGPIDSESLSRRDRSDPSYNIFKV
jgi:ketosteroid isomerase-like protein